MQKHQPQVITVKQVPTATLNIEFLYAPPLTPMIPIFETLEALMLNPVAKHVVAVVPWQAITNSAKRTKEIIDWGLFQLIHLPRRAFPGTSVQACVLDMWKHHAGNSTFWFME
jgi:hypothetical protein